MNQLYDTNIVINIIRSNRQEILTFLNPENANIYISVATEAEIKSLAIRNGWGRMRLDKLDYFDAYSFSTPRNMGKNDLWIASLASLLGLKLVTMDDFDHLNGIFFEIRKVSQHDLSLFF